MQAVSLVEDVRGRSLPEGQPGIPVPVNAWTTFSANGFPAEVVGYDATVYATAIRRHVVLGKYHHYGSEPNYCMDGWSWDENRWDVLDCGADFHTEHSMEGGHPVGAFVYMPNRGSILYWGGQSGSNQPEQAFHTWWWDVQGRSGRDKIGNTRPGLIKVSSMAYDAYHDKGVFYPDAAFQVEIYDPATNRWSSPAVSGTPPPKGLTFPTLEWNSNDQKAYLFGGAIGNNCATGLNFNSDLYTFDVADRRWSKLEIANDPANGAPAGRWYAGFAFDPDHNTFLLAGGQVCMGRIATGLLDTWRLDPVARKWTKLNPSSNYKLREPGGAPFQKLRYDPDHHAFVMVLTSFDNRASTSGNWGNYPARVWVFCDTGPCPNVGSSRADSVVPSVSLNRNGGQPITPINQTWASDTAIAAGERNVYGGWIETGLPFTGGGCLFHHPYVQSLAGTSWTPLGAACTAMDAKAESIERDAEKLSIAVVNGTPWASWSEENDFIPEILAKFWNGRSWVGGAIGKRNNKGYQGFSQIISVAGVPTIGFIENNRSLFPDITEAYVDQYNGTSWLALGSKLNVHSSGRVESLGVTADGNKPLICWTEAVVSGWSTVRPGQLYCAKWDRPKWKTLGSALNNSTSDWAADTAVTFGDGQLYVAWTERTIAGNALLYVKRWNGSNWSPLGGPLNRDSNSGWAFHPRLVADETRIYLSWEEQSELGKPSQLYVTKWDGQRWSSLGDALNIDSSQGTAAHSSMTVRQHAPIVLWNEVRMGQLQQTYGKSWDGFRWVSLPAWSGSPLVGGRQR
jgi:hypothetical protein